MDGVGHSSSGSRIVGARLRVSGIGVNNNNPPQDFPDFSDSSSDEECEEWTDAITVHDDDDEQNADPDRGQREMVCYRCPNKRTGKFDDVEKFQIHIRRHKFGEHFACVTCGRPFTQINYCISHEMRVHGTEINYDPRDKVIALARTYIEERRAKRAQRALARERRGEGESAVEEPSDDETDSEDPKFYDDQVVSSTTLYKYRGPPVKHIVESYAIQVKFAHPRFQRATQTARLALQAYGLNVRKKIIPNYVGQDTKLKQVAGLLAKKGLCGKAAKAAGRPKAGTKRPSPAESSGAGADSDNQPSKKNVRNGAGNKSRK